MFSHDHHVFASSIAHVPNFVTQARLGPGSNNHTQSLTHTDTHIITPTHKLDTTFVVRGVAQPLEHLGPKCRVVSRGWEMWLD